MITNDHYIEAFKCVDRSITDIVMDSQLTINERKQILKELKPRIDEWLLLMAFSEDDD